ncbi:RagB/SusD domain protein [Marssonina coronariae]|uniref:RagB/SusD domain protein n=1 Tax=Diplocarpon coronariae TaxID=2795749 RepID=A0A218YRL8_9HELO|nr:RagB/SusD domain protein [Marssonina coronariae]
MAFSHCFIKASASKILTRVMILDEAWQEVAVLLRSSATSPVTAWILRIGQGLVWQLKIDEFRTVSKG